MGTAFAIGIALNSLFVVAEVAAGLWSSSLALLADAGHNLSDVLALLLAWGAVVLAKRAPVGRRTYGLRKATILASLANAVMLLVAVSMTTPVEMAAGSARRRIDSETITPTATSSMTALAREARIVALRRP